MFGTVLQLSMASVAPITPPQGGLPPVSGMRRLICASNNFSMSVAALSVGEYRRERRKRIAVVHDQPLGYESTTRLKLAAVRGAEEAVASPQTSNRPQRLPHHSSMTV